jgi:ABC-2 type transport system permease protein/lipopolysaccharide transport system permease protein
MDIHVRYRRSILGPLWLTLSMAVTLGFMAAVYSIILKVDSTRYVPYLAIGLPVWTFISTVLNESAGLFTTSKTAIHTAKLPLSMYPLKAIWRNLIILAHNFIIVVAVWIWWGIWPGWNLLLFAAGLGLITLTGTAWLFILGVAGARFRDIEPMVGSLMTPMFLLTPIIWYPSQLRGYGALLNWNPFYHYLEIVRQPLLAASVDPFNWWFTVFFTLTSVVLAAFVFIRYHRSIPVWV